MAFAQDVLTRIVNVHLGVVDQQGLLAEYPPDPGGDGYVMSGTPTAYALDSGQSFHNVNMGASGLGHTVLTKGLVCFGKPRNGDACFIAAPDFKYFGVGAGGSLKRGVLNEEDDGTLIWNPTAGGSGTLLALSFAGDAFFAVYQREDDSKVIATSYDGVTWTSGPAFISGPNAWGGAVAAVKQPAGNYFYTACGDISQEDPLNEFANSVENLMWATSNDGTSWSSGSNSGVMTEPGTWYRSTFNYACTVAGGRVGNKSVFVAAAATKSLIIDPEGGFQYAMMTSAPAISTTGVVWKPTAVGLPGALDQISWGLAVTYVRTKGDNGGYFLMSDHEYITGEVGHDIPRSTLYKSSDDAIWIEIRNNENWMSTLSAVANDLSETTIVTI